MDMKGSQIEFQAGLAGEALFPEPENLKTSAAPPRIIQTPFRRHSVSIL
jgi:hypothetical protein